MIVRWLIAILVLPGTVVVFVPAAVVRVTGAEATFAGMALIPGLLGLGLAIWTSSLFFRVGKGTPAPWDPPKRLVVPGPYRYVRNPMITSVLLMLAAEALIFQSWPIAVWLGLFFAGNAVYFPWVEEKGLRRRFGEDYVNYCRHVPRWLLRLTPWRDCDTKQT